jgi:hypothetical protein
MAQMVVDLHMSDEVGRETGYRSVSGWAIAGLLLGILSAAAVVGPILWLIPVFASVVSAIGLFKIKHSEGQISGWGLALLGLLLAVFFGAAGPARSITRRIWLESRADRFAQAFVDLLEQNKPVAAHELTRPASARKPLVAETPDPFPKDPEGKKDYDAFLKLEPVQFLITGQQKAVAKLISTDFVASDDRSDILAVVFRFEGPPGETIPGDQFMYLQRTLAYGTQLEEWQIIRSAFRPVEPK